MTFTDALLAGREALLNGVLFTRPNAVLNEAENRDKSGAWDGVRIAAELKRVISNLYATAFNPANRGVDYARLREHQAYADYRACAARLAAFDPGALTTRQEQLAFWINLYNALVVDAVIAFDVQASVTEGPLGVLRFFRRAAYNVGGYRVSCDDIEHGILRANRGHIALPGPQFGPSDPRCAWVITPPDLRVHFALNCASRSCPPISFYDAAQIDAQLDLATRNVVAVEVRINRARREVHLSRIFQWYASDFGGKTGVVDFLLRYLEDEEIGWLSGHREDAHLVYRPYDWSLNAA